MQLFFINVSNYTLLIFNFIHHFILCEISICVRSILYPSRHICSNILNQIMFRKWDSIKLKKCFCWFWHKIRQCLVQSTLIDMNFYSISQLVHSKKRNYFIYSDWFCVISTYSHSPKILFYRILLKSFL